MDDVDLVRRQPHVVDGEPRARASLMAMIRRAWRASVRSAWRHGPVRNGSGLCFVETIGVRRPRARRRRLRGRGACARGRLPTDGARGRGARRRVRRTNGTPARLEGVVERIRVRHVEADEARVDTACRERRQQRQQMALRAADAADPVNVHYAHAGSLGLQRSSSQTTAAPAANASRKSHGTR